MAVVLVAGGIAWIATLAPEHAAGSGAFAVHVVGPDGPLANGTVALDGANALTALQALAAAQGFTVDVEEQAWIGDGCTRHYVRGIAGHDETATGGWNFYVRRAGEAWEWQSMGAACRGLQPGEDLEWCWVEADVCRHHTP